MSNDTDVITTLRVENEALQTENSRLQQRIVALEAERIEKQEEEAMLRKSHEQLQLVIEATNDAIWDWNLKTGEVYFSPRWQTMIGYEPDELEGSVKTWEKLLHPEDAQHALDTLNEHLQGHTPFLSMEFRLKMKSGEWKWIHSRGKVVSYDEDGQPYRLFGTHIDIAIQKEAEAVVKNSHHILTTVMDSIEALIYVADMDTHEVLYMNRFGREAFGEANERPCWQVLQKDQEEPCSWCTNDRLIDTDGNPTGPHQWEFQNNINGRWYNIVDQAIRWTDGRIVRLEIATDMHDSKAAADEIRIFKAVVENSPEGVGFVSNEGIITYANAALKRMLGYGDEYIGLPASIMFGENSSRPIHIIEQTMAHGSWQGREIYYRKDGTPLDVHVSVFPIRDDNDNIISFPGIVHDLTEYKQAEAEREALQQQIIESQQTAIRELSTPLLPIAQNVLALPLVGSIDSNRANLIMETLLEGIATYQTDVAIVDITGVKVMDTQVAQALIRTAQAVQLLGAQVVLTGIQPHMAQTLVHLGADMSSIVTRSTLQRGIAYVLERAEH